MAVPTDEELRGLLERFVCVRLVQMWGVDLRRFQFDQAMTWSIFLMHDDGTIYARYGTRSALQKESARDISLAGFKRTLTAALELHRRYGADAAAVRPSLAGKQTRHPPAWPSPEKIPTLARNKRLAVPFSAFAEQPNLRAHGVGCIHCHMVPSNELMSLRAAGKPIADRLVWPYPMPYAVGLHMDPQRCASVQRTVAGSAATDAGLRPGDEILQFDGQAILSTADLQWVLHNLADAARLPVVYRRDGETRQTTLELPAGWRRRLGDWRFVNLGICVQIAGFNGRPTRDGGRRLAIRIQRVAPKRAAGKVLVRNDVIIALDGQRAPMNLGQLTRFLLDKKPGSELAVTVLRRGQERTFRYAID